MRWWLAATVAFALLAVAIGAGLWVNSRGSDVDDGYGLPISAPAVAKVEGVRAADCRSCHEDVFEEWSESHHAHANHEINAADREMFVSTGLPEDSSVAFTSGGMRIRLRTEAGEQWFTPPMVLAHTPLRQLLIPWEDGGLQVSQIAWDPHKKEWFSVYDDQRRAGEWGAWTGRAMNWNSSCAYCHMTDFDKGYDPESNRYASTWVEQGVSCIQCHAPLVETPLPGRSEFCAPMTATQTIDNCASCHSRRAEFDGGFGPGERYEDHYHLELPTRDGLYYPDGQIRDEDYVWTSLMISKMGHQGVRCLDCHNPHSGETILPIDNNALCMRCHGAGLDGATVIQPEAHSFHQPDSTGNRCVECHMPHTVYMQRDSRRDHGFLIPDPLLTQQLGIPNACARCHDGQDPQAGTYSTQELVDWVRAKWGDDINASARTRAPVLAAAYPGEASAREGLLSLVANEENAYWLATYMELLQPWPADPQVQAEARRLSQHAVPRLRAAAHAILAQSDAASAHEALSDDAGIVRYIVGNLRPDLLGEYPGVKEELKAIARFNSDQPGGALQMAAQAAEAGDTDAALSWYQRARDYDPYSPGIAHQYAFFLNSIGRRPEAIDMMREAVRLGQDQALPAFHLALLYGEAGQAADAEAALREAVSRDPQFARAWYNLGLLLAQRGAVNEAVDALRRANAADPSSPDYPYAEATIHMRQGRVEDARAAALKALKADPSYPPALQLLNYLSGGQP